MLERHLDLLTTYLFIANLSRLGTLGVSLDVTVELCTVNRLPSLFVLVVCIEPDRC